MSNISHTDIIDFMIEIQKDMKHNQHFDDDMQIRCETIAQISKVIEVKDIKDLQYGDGYVRYMIQRDRIKPQLAINVHVNPNDIDIALTEYTGRLKIYKKNDLTVIYSVMSKDMSSDPDRMLLFEICS